MAQAAPFLTARGWLMLGLVVLACGLAPSTATAQATTVPGVVWTPPSNLERAWEDLYTFWHTGIRAVRTGLVTDELILAYADTLGLQVYQELPVAHAPAAVLQDTLAAMQTRLEQALRQARNHPSARHFGLARYADTSTPTACAYFETLNDLVRAQGPPDTRTYYLTRFIEDDVCHATVDLVLVDGRDVPNPLALRARWRHATPVGLGDWGAWVDPNQQGLGLPHAPETSARYLETWLPRLIDPASGWATVFLHRWRDTDADAFAQDNPYGYRYGLHAADGQARPARRVVTGILSGGQAAFAFPVGPAPKPDPPMLLLIGWLIIGALAVLYAVAPRFRFALPRYFFAHSFFRDGIRDGRDVLPNANFILLGATALSVGLIGTVIFQALPGTAPFDYLLGRIPGGLRHFALLLLDQPALLLLLIAFIDGLALMGWAALMPLFLERYLQPRQTMMLAVWSRWPVVVLMIAGLVLSTKAPAAVALLLALLALLTLLVLVLGVVRTLRDVHLMGTLSVNGTLILLSTNLVALTLIVAGILALFYRADTAFLWHLLTRT